MNVTVVLIIAFLLRLVALNQSLWLDEATTAMTVKTYSFIDIITKYSPQDFHPPLYYLLMKAWTLVFGYSDIALRMPSVFASILTGLIIYKIGTLLKDKHAGLWAMIFFLFNPLIVYYSHEARMYSLATLFTTATLHFFLKLRKKWCVNDFIYLSITIILSLSTFYGTVFFIATLILYLILTKQFRVILYILPGLFISAILLGPLFIIQLNNSHESLRMVPNWYKVLGQANLKDLLLIPVKFTSGRISWDPKKTYYAVSGIWLLIVGYFFVRGAKNSRKFFVILFFAPILLGFLISFYKPLLQYFRFIYVIPVMSIILAFGAQKQWQKFLILGGFLVFTFAYLFNPTFHREDWKSLTRALGKNEAVYMIVSSSDPIRYYRPDLKIRDIKSPDSSSPKILIIPYTADIHGYNYAEELKKKNRTRKKTTSYRGLQTEVWTHHTQ